MIQHRGSERCRKTRVYARGGRPIAVIALLLLESNELCEEEGVSARSFLEICGESFVADGLRGCLPEELSHVFDREGTQGNGVQ
jgi:hypothetical protein